MCQRRSVLHEPQPQAPAIDEAQKPQFELQKLVGEVHKIAAETAKTKSELINLEKFPIFEVVRTAGAFFIAVAAIGTISWNIHTSSIDSDRRLTERISLLVQELGAKEPPRRAAAAVGLGLYINEKAGGEFAPHAMSILDTLMFAMSLESDVHVLDAILATLQKAQQDILA